MPRGDGTGPMGGGFGAGRGMGGGVSAGRGRGRMGGTALGAGGSCVCPKCGKIVPHQRGVPCNQVQCPACGSLLNRGQ